MAGGIGVCIVPLRLTTDPEIDLLGGIPRQRPTRIGIDSPGYELRIPECQEPILLRIRLTQENLTRFVTIEEEATSLTNMNSVQWERKARTPTLNKF